MEKTLKERDKDKIETTSSKRKYKGSVRGKINSDYKKKYEEKNKSWDGSLNHTQKKK